MEKDSLGDRMKDYESRSFRYLNRRTPVLMRIDGKCFSQWTKGLERPFDLQFKHAMNYAMLKTCSPIDGARFGYCQSDEISILICDYQDIDTQAWFDYRANKIESVAASICTASFNHAAMVYLPIHYRKKGSAYFDARAWNIPKEEVTNYAYWRQKDCLRNSLSQLSRAYFSHKQLMHKNSSDMQEMLMTEKNINWNNLDTMLKRGSVVFKLLYYLDKEKNIIRHKWAIDHNIPDFHKSPEYIQQFIDNVSVSGKLIDLSNVVTCEDLWKNDTEDL